MFEQRVFFPLVPSHAGLIEHLRQATQFRLEKGSVPIRFAVTSLSEEGYECEIGTVDGPLAKGMEENASIFDFRHRGTENAGTFNVVFLIPTGIGAEIGGHAGDGTPVARLLAEGCDTLILHPNVVNASDINEAPENSLYLEGSVITRLLMGTLGVQKVRANRMLVVVDGDHDDIFINATINSVNAARACYGLQCADVLKMVPPVRLKAAYSESGRATGTIENLTFLFEELEKRRGDYDAVAIASVIDIPDGLFKDYFDSEGEVVNPWGGVEAMLTHAISMRFDVPTAHAPMMESREVAGIDPGRVDPRMAAEAVSMTFLNCVLKGLQKSPRIITDESLFDRSEVITASNVSCLIIPDGCLGLPTLAALEQDIPVIAVKENRNLMRNDLTALPWRAGQFHLVDNYLEAAGLMNALKAGIAPESVRRPLAYIETLVRDRNSDLKEDEDGDQTSKTGARS